MKKRKFLIALPSFRGDKGWNHPTILVSAESENEAIAIAKNKKPKANIGDVKEVFY